ncbi:phage integrase Arm DNA-binding domain-containing protein [Alcanivorax sp. DP30]|uniref:phage integrase Arm DNA-binding domain-containing protein n=1 Tax=Alcanivorax sp. DP30 TaxID=2606217 RepID=UPI00136C2AD7|nr:phage integrase Arm DNA-binding domain-containing protein [Alcanivorax sp. DP30]MZR63812.1 tyrosine-type recombinase/integrase [Alcanivorax sp. DP30]
MAPRPRKKGNHGLPPNLYPNGRAYRYRRPDTGTWHGMGTNKQEAIKAAKILNAELAAPGDLVAGVLGTQCTMGQFLDSYEADVLPHRDLAKATLDLYAVRIRQIRAALGEAPVDQITIRHVARFLDGLTARASNQARALLVDVFAHAIAKGLCQDNPAAATMARIEKKQRKRHTVEGIAAIRAKAEPWLQNAIDLALVTAQRREDILNMKFEDVRDGALYVVQSKTKRHTDAGWLRLPLTPALQEIIARCRDNIASPYLIHRKPDRKVKKDGHWTKVDNRYLTRAFKAARDDAKCYAHLSEEEMPGFHELRATSLHLYKKAGKDGQAIAGHASGKMTRNYEADHDDVVWKEAIADLDISKIRG